MPWKVRKGGKRGWQILKESAGGKWKVVGNSDTKADAQASVRARYASEGKK